MILEYDSITPDVNRIPMEKTHVLSWYSLVYVHVCVHNFRQRISYLDPVCVCLRVLHPNIVVLFDWTRKELAVLCIVGKTVVKCRPVLHYCVVIFLLVLWDHGLYVYYKWKKEIRSCARGRQWCGICLYLWWTASIKPRLLLMNGYFPMWVMLPEGFPFHQVIDNEYVGFSEVTFWSTKDG